MFAQPCHAKVRSQADSGGPEACSVVAAFYADLILNHSVGLSAPALDRMLDTGCGVWRVLSSALAASQGYLTAFEVVDGVRLRNGGARRWRIDLECYGLHTYGAVPPQILDAFAATAGVNSDVQAAVPMHFCKDGLASALRRIDTLLTTERPAVAALLTTGAPAHTIAVGARLFSDYAQYYVIDSLEGSFVTLDAPTQFVNYCCDLIPRYNWTDETAAGLALDPNAERRNLPGQFFLSVIDIAQHSQNQNQTQTQTQN